MALVAPGPVQSGLATHGLRVEVDGALGEDADLLVVACSGSADGREEGSAASSSVASSRDDWRPPTRAARRSPGSEQGPRLLAAARLLDGRAAITHRVAVEELRGYGARIVKEPSPRAWSTSAAAVASTLARTLQNPASRFAVCAGKFL